MPRAWIHSRLTQSTTLSRVRSSRSNRATPLACNASETHSTDNRGTKWSRKSRTASLRALEITHAATLVRPFHGGGRHELVKMPKVYGFDTGLVSFARGWDPLRHDDFGPLWEHLVLERCRGLAVVLRYTGVA